MPYFLMILILSDIIQSKKFYNIGIRYQSYKNHFFIADGEAK
jgi:hypothetical protein